MSDLPPELDRPAPQTWRDRLIATAESLDLSPRRLIAGAVALAVVGVLAWRALAPPAPPAEMELPFAPSAAPAEAGTTGPPGEAGPAGGPAAAAASATATDGADGGRTGAGAPGAAGAAGSEGAVPPTEVVVHVAGAVRAPGVQRLPGGARVVDAVDAAGGAVPEADLGRINLAVPVEDGQQVYVPRVGEVPPPSAAAPGETGGAAADGAGAEGAPVNVNTASADELDTLPGVGPATAEAIIAYREANGPFTSVDQLLDVRGIGEAKLEQMRPRVVV